MLTVQQLIDIIAMPPGTVQDLFLEIDGQPIGTTTDWLAHQQTTDPNDSFGLVINSPHNLPLDFGYDPTLGTGDPFDPARYPTTILPFTSDG